MQPGLGSHGASENGQPIKPDLMPLQGEEVVTATAHAQAASYPTTNDISREEERRGTRQVWMWGITLIATIFVALLVASFLATTL
jgi:hypothetical protein